jgi:hypothetical protein
MWVFSQNTIAGDLGVTPIVQCLASMLITSTLVHTDLHHHAVAPLPFVYPHVEHLPDPRTLFAKRSKGSLSPDEKNASTPQKKGLAYYVAMLIRFIFEGTEKNMLAERVGVRAWLGRFIWTASQGAAIGVVLGFPVWCLAIVILGPIYQDNNMGSGWAPQIIKMVYGAIVGWITNPVIAILALGSQSEHHLIVVEEKVEDGGIRTILEEEEGMNEGLGEPRETTLRPPVFPSTPSRHRANTAASHVSQNSHHSHTSVPSSPFSLRPPLTANVSHLSPTNGLLPPQTPTRESYTRPRGATVTSTNTQRSFSYSLGGTGGRAQRPRAASRASARGVMPVFSPSLGRKASGILLAQPVKVLENVAGEDVFGSRPTLGDQRSTPGVKARIFGVRIPAVPSPEVGRPIMPIAVLITSRPWHWRRFWIKTLEIG